MSHRERRNILARAGAIAAVFLLCSPSRAAADASSGKGNPWKEECEYGITMALSGKSAAAESAFVSLLSHSPGDARALNNLGNVHLYRGEADVALVFYGFAMAQDSSDAGILLNRSVALLALGRVAEAESVAARGVEASGGAGSAEDLLGMSDARMGETSARGSEMSARVPLLRPGDGKSARVAVTQADVRRLLGARAATSTPSSRSDTTRSAESRPSPAGTRAASAADALPSVYWKR